MSQNKKETRFEKKTFVGFVDNEPFDVIENVNDTRGVDYNGNLHFEGEKYYVEDNLGNRIFYSTLKDSEFYPEAWERIHISWSDYFKTWDELTDEEKKLAEKAERR